MITATFSNGHVDAYRGRRPVRAAWMITDSTTGSVIASGHSLDENKARTTADRRVSDEIRNLHARAVCSRDRYWARAARAAADARGITMAEYWNEIDAAQARRRAELKIEVVTL